MRVPKNKIIESKYTSGGEFIETNNNPYKGYYYEINNSFYAGKTMSVNAKKLTKIENKNKLFNNNNTAVFSKISGVTSQQLQEPKINSISSNNNIVEFYCTKINSNLIKQIDEETYISLQKDFIYKTTYIGIYQGKTQTLDKAETDIPGIKAFLG